MLTLLLGSDWTANRSAILDMIANDVAAENPNRVLIVPELISHETERRLCAVAGDTCSRYAEVLSFTRLVSRVSESVGHATPSCLDNGGRVVAMASAARQLHSKLKAYASVETRPEFLTSLLEAVDEFKRCCITSHDLLSASQETMGSLAQKLEELALLLEAYNSLCQQGKCDPRDQMTWLLEELETCDFARNHVFYVDGFPDFTRQNFAILMHLIQESTHVTVSLNCDMPDSSAMAFEKAGQTAAELIRRTKKLGIPVEVRYIPSRKDGLSALRDYLFQGKIDRNVPQLHTYHFETVYQEACYAMEQVFNLVRAGARYRDIGVVCADMTTYHNVVEFVFNRANIPSYISGTEDILDKSAVATVLSAMDAALNGFDQKDVFKYLKSMLSPIDMELCDKVENYAILWNIQGNAWLEDWTHHPNGLGQDWSDTAKQRLQLLNQARSVAIEPLKHLRDGFRNAKKIQHQVEALYTFFEEISLSRRLSQIADLLDEAGDNRNAQILNQLWEILLSAIEQLYDVLGETTWDDENFTRLFKLLLSQYDVGTIPPVLDAVTVGSVSAMRCTQCKHLIVLGAQEGNLPSYGGSVGVLSDHERTELRRIGVPLTGGAMEGVQAEFSEIYGVFCGAEESVCISYSGAQPSFVFRRLSALSGNVCSADNAGKCTLGNAYDVAAYLARMDAQNVASSLGLLHDYQKIREYREHQLGSISRENVQKLYGDSLLLSASQVDRQAECRLMYFLKYGLRAKERKPATIDPAEFGTYVHAVMENTVKEVMELGGFRKVSAQQTIGIARKYSQEYAVERFSEIDTERLNFLFERNTIELEMIVEELWKEMQLSEFEPIGFEVGFGDNREIPAIDVSGKSMPAQLRGFVDRVDLWRDGEKRFFRVVDYKTGKKDFDYCDIYNGYGLQMLLYLFALEQNSESLLGENPIPAGVQYFPARVPLVSADGLLTDEEAEAAREKIWKRRGLILSHENVLMAMENREQSVRMPYSRKKDGTLSGDVADRGQFDLLKAYVFFLVGSMVDDIASGNISPNPYTRGSSHDACAYCPYSMICHKETVEDRRNYKTISSQQFWEDVEKEMSRNG